MGQPFKSQLPDDPEKLWQRIQVLTFSQNAHLSTGEYSNDLMEAIMAAMKLTLQFLTHDIDLLLGIVKGDQNSDNDDDYYNDDDDDSKVEEIFNDLNDYLNVFHLCSFLSEKLHYNLQDNEVKTHCNQLLRTLFELYREHLSWWSHDSFEKAFKVWSYQVVMRRRKREGFYLMFASDSDAEYGFNMLTIAFYATLAHTFKHNLMALPLLSKYIYPHTQKTVHIQSHFTAAKGAKFKFLTEAFDGKFFFIKEMYRDMSSSHYGAKLKAKRLEQQRQKLDTAYTKITDFAVVGDNNLYVPQVSISKAEILINTDASALQARLQVELSDGYKLVHPFYIKITANYQLMHLKGDKLIVGDNGWIMPFEVVIFRSDVTSDAIQYKTMLFWKAGLAEPMWTAWVKTKNENADAKKTIIPGLMAFPIDADKASDTIDVIDLQSFQYGVKRAQPALWRESTLLYHITSSDGYIPDVTSSIHLYGTSACAFRFVGTLPHLKKKPSIEEYWHATTTRNNPKYWVAQPIDDDGNVVLDYTGLLPPWYADLLGRIEYSKSLNKVIAPNWRSLLSEAKVNVNSQHNNSGVLDSVFDVIHVTENTDALLANEDDKESDVANSELASDADSFQDTNCVIDPSQYGF